MPATAFTTSSDPSDPGSYAGGAVVITTRRKSASPCTPRSRLAVRRTLSTPRLSNINKTELDEILNIANKIKPGRASQAQPSDGNGDSGSSVAIHAQNDKAIDGAQASSGGQLTSGASAGTVTGKGTTPGGQSTSGGRTRSQPSRGRRTGLVVGSDPRLTSGTGAPYTPTRGHGQHQDRREGDPPPTGGAGDCTAGTKGSRSIGRVPSPAAAMGPCTAPDSGAQAGSGADHFRPTNSATTSNARSSGQPAPIDQNFHDTLNNIIANTPNLLPPGVRPDDYVDAHGKGVIDGKYVDANGPDSIEAKGRVLPGPQAGGNAA